MMKASIFLGPPGAGKGTQATLVAQRLGLQHVSTGALFRTEIESGSELGGRIKEVVNSGQLVSDELLFETLRAKLKLIESADTDAHVLLDGVPRTLGQVAQLDTLVAAGILKLHCVLALTAPLEKLVERFASRWTCKSCGTVHAVPDPAKAPALACAQCGAQGTLFRRKDDSPETVTTRFQVYQESTAPLVAAYARRGILMEIDALRPPEVVYVGVATALLKND